MLNPFLAAALLLTLVAPGSTPESRPLDWQQAVQAARRTQSFVIHVPRVTVTRATVITRSVPAPPIPPRPPLVLTEGKERDCVKMEAVRGFSVNRADSVDLMLTDGKYMRVKLGKDCPALGFYSGFYVKAHADKKMCAGRDSIRSRSGRLCSVEGLRSLIPAK